MKYELKAFNSLFLIAWMCFISGKISAQNYPNQWVDFEQPLIEQADSIIKAGSSLEKNEAQKQALQNTDKVKINLKSANNKQLIPTDLYQKVAKATVIITDACLCDNCDNLHIFPSSGYLISEDGICVTNYHVLNFFMNRDGHYTPKAFVAQLHDGRTLAVKEVLVASPEYDLVILQLDTPDKNLPCLALDADAEIGADVFIVSHPQGMYYTLSSGIVTGKMNVEFPTFNNEGVFNRNIMTISADFATGSSGAAVVNNAGNVIGTVSATRTLFHTGLPDKPVQMVVKSILPVSLLKLLIK